MAWRGTADFYRPVNMPHLVDAEREWRVLALSSDRSQGLGFSVADRTETDIKDLIPDTKYTIECCWKHIPGDPPTSHRVGEVAICMGDAIPGHHGLTPNGDIAII